MNANDKEKINENIPNCIHYDDKTSIGNNIDLLKKENDEYANNYEIGKNKVFEIKNFITEKSLNSNENENKQIENLTKNIVPIDINFQYTLEDSCTKSGEIFENIIKENSYFKKTEIENLNKEDIEKLPKNEIGIENLEIKNIHREDTDIENKVKQEASKIKNSCKPNIEVKLEIEVEDEENNQKIKYSSDEDED